MPLLVRLSLVVCLGLVSLAAGGCQGSWKSLDAVNPFKRPDVGPQVRSPAERIEEMRGWAQNASSLPPSDAERISQSLLVSIQKEEDPLMRMEILKTLAVIPTATAGAVLEAAMNDPDRNVRSTLCTAWRLRGGPDAPERLKTLLQTDSDVDVRMTAARELGLLRDPSAVATLGALLDDPDPAMQHRAIQSLRLVTNKEFGDDVAAWRAYTRGENPQELSIVSRFMRKIY